MRESKSRKHKESYKRHEHEVKNGHSDTKYERKVVKEVHKKEIEEDRSWKKRDGSSKPIPPAKRSKHDQQDSNDTRTDHRKHSPKAYRSSRHTERSPSKESNGNHNLKKRKYKHRGESPSHESYEELSRRKRKIESELHALDLEEAAQKKEVENKSRRRNSNRKPAPAAHIKEEPLTDSEDHRRHKSTHEPRNKNRHPSKSSNDDKRWGKPSTESKKPEQPKEKPNFAVSGKLAEDTNTFNGVVIKYNEPTEARKPKRRWRLYPFKGDTSLPFIPVHRQSAYLFGRTRLIADIPIDHPSCSKQHAVLQYRLVSYKRDDGTTGRRVRPYIIDLESSNGTFVNNKKIDPRCYVELMERDVVKFGFSSREYVVLHEESQKEFEDDDYVEEDKSE